MIERVRNFLLQQNAKSIEENKILNAKVLTELHWQKKEQIMEDLHLSEFKVFSQFGDDGIIQFLVKYLEIQEEVFVEFGVETYVEANTRFLLMNNNWRGLIMDGSEKNVKKIKKDPIYWQFDLTAKPVFITKDNINKVIQEEGIKGDIGLLHIDIDGNDYWVWKEITVIHPVIVIVEYNSVLGSNNPWTIPYQENFVRLESHYSNLYWGSSLLSLCDLAEEKGYYFVGCNSNGNNAYFVRKDKIKGLKPKTAEQGFVLSKFRDSRDQKGNLTYLRGEERYDMLRGTSMYNTRTNQIEVVK